MAASVVEAILRLRDQASAGLQSAAGSAQRLAGALDAADDRLQAVGAGASSIGRSAIAPLTAQAQAARAALLDLGEATAQQAASLGDLADAGAWIAGMPAAVLGGVAAWGALTDQVQSARLELEATARDAGLSRDQVLALQTAARVSGRSISDLAAEYKALDRDGRAAVDRLAGSTGALASVTDQQVQDAKRWKAALEEVYGVYDSLTAWAADTGSGLGQSLIDGTIYAAAIVSSVVAEVQRRFSALFEVIEVTARGTASVVAESWKSLASGDLSGVRAAQDAFREALIDANDRALVEASEDWLQVLKNAKEEADGIAAAIGQARGQRIAAADALSGAQTRTAAAGRAGKPGPVLSGQGADDSILRLWQDMARNLEILALSPVAQGASQVVQNPETDRLLRIAGGELTAAERDQVRQARTGRTLAGVQAGLSVAGQVASGDLAGLAGLAGGPGGAIASASIGLLSQIGDMGADKIVSEIQAQADAIARGIAQLPDLVVGLVEALPEIAAGLVRAVALELPRAILDALGDWWRSIWRELKDALNPLSGEGRMRQFERSRGILDTAAGGFLSRSGVRSPGADPRRAQSRAAISAGRRSATVVREPYESRRLSRRQASEDAFLTGEG